MQVPEQPQNSASDRKLVGGLKSIHLLHLEPVGRLHVEAAAVEESEGSCEYGYIELSPNDRCKWRCDDHVVQDSEG